MSREAEKENLIKSLESIVELLKKEHVELRSVRGQISIHADVEAVNVTGEAYARYLRTGFVNVRMEKYITLFDRGQNAIPLKKKEANEGSWVDITTANERAKGKKTTMNTKTGEKIEVDWRR